MKLQLVDVLVAAVLAPTAIRFLRSSSAHRVARAHRQQLLQVVGEARLRTSRSVQGVAAATALVRAAQERVHLTLVPGGGGARTAPRAGAPAPLPADLAVRLHKAQLALLALGARVERVHAEHALAADLEEVAGRGLSVRGLLTVFRVARTSLLPIALHGSARSLRHGVAELGLEFEAQASEVDRLAAGLLRDAAAPAEESLAATLAEADAVRVQGVA